MFRTWAPEARVKSIIDGTSWALRSVTEKWIWNGRPWRRQWSIPARVFSQLPGRPRKASWLAGSRESRLIPIPMAPACFSACTRCPVSSTPLLPTTMASPRPLPWATRRSRSGRSRGSPPVSTTMVSLLRPAISSSSRSTSMLVSSSSPPSCRVRASM